MPVFRLRQLAVVAWVVVAGAACRRAEPPRRAGVILDDFGAPVRFGGAAKRIVSLSPTTTEILFAIGAGSRLVGRSQYDNFPDAARAVPNLGLALRPNVEAVLGATPDLVILYASDDNRAAANRLRAAGVPTVAFRIDSIEQFERDTRLIGRLTGDSAAAAAIVDSVSATLERVRAATAGLPRPSVFIPSWDTPVIAIGGGSFITQLLHIAGARNIYDSVAAPSVAVTLEDVVRRNPDVVLASPVALPRMRSSESWRAIAAVREGRLFAYDTVLVWRPSVQLGAAARSLAMLLHPTVVIPESR